MPDATVRWVAAACWDTGPIGDGFKTGVLS